MPLPVVFGAAPPAAGALGLPGAVAPGLPPAPPVCANAAVVISSADTIATGTNVLADILRLLLALRNFAKSILVKTTEPLRARLLRRGPQLRGIFATSLSSQA